jgi:hypothetical protein
MSERQVLPRGAAWIVIAGCLFLPLGLYLSIFVPRNDHRRHDLWKRIQAADLRIEMGRSAERKLPEFRNEARRIQQALAERRCKQQPGSR